MTVRLHERHNQSGGCCGISPGAFRDRAAGRRNREVATSSPESFELNKVLVVFALISIAAIVFAIAMAPEMERRDKVHQQQEAKARAAKLAKQKKDEAWQQSLKQYSDERAKDAKGPREAGFDQGFQIGFGAGKVTRSKTNVSLKASQIESMAQKQIQTLNVPANSHAGFVRGFSAGWSLGWADK